MISAAFMDALIVPKRWPTASSFAAISDFTDSVEVRAGAAGSICAAAAWHIGMTLAETALTGASDSSINRLPRTALDDRQSSPTTSRARPSSNTFLRPSFVSDAAVSAGIATKVFIRKGPEGQRMEVVEATKTEVHATHRNTSKRRLFAKADVEQICGC